MLFLYIQWLSTLLTSDLCNALKALLIMFFFLLQGNTSAHTHTHICPDFYNLEIRAVSDGYRKWAVAWGRREGGQIRTGEERKEETGGLDQRPNMA